MRYRVTGGSSGVSGIDVADKRYEAGDEIDLTAKQAEWLLDQGYVEPLETTKKKGAPVVESTPEATIEPTVEDN